MSSAKPLLGASTQIARTPVPHRLARGSREEHLACLTPRTDAVPAVRFWPADRWLQWAFTPPDTAKARPYSLTPQTRGPTGGLPLRRDESSDMPVIPISKHDIDALGVPGMK